MTELENNNVDVAENTDNSDVSNTEPEVSDNSNVDNNEPVETSGVEESQRFKSLEDATKSYSELEKKLGEQSNELGELRKKAELVDQLQQNQQQFLNNYGFNTMEEYQDYQNEQQFVREIAAFQADEYAKSLNRADDVEEIKSLLLEYRANPSKELLDIIESQFPLEVVKEVSGNTAVKRGQLQNQYIEAQNKMVEDSARAFLKENIEKYPDLFKNQAFAELYGEAFRAYGLNLQTDKFISLLKNYGDSVLKAAGIEKGISLDNIQETDEIAGLTNSTTVAAPKEKNILDMTEAEVRKELAKYN